MRERNEEMAVRERHMETAQHGGREIDRKRKKKTEKCWQQVTNSGHNLHEFTWYSGPRKEDKREELCLAPLQMQ